MKQAIVLLSFIFLLTGCASQKAVTKHYLVDDQNKYVAINLDIDAGRYVSYYEANVVDYIYDSFEESGLFSNVETGFSRWPITVQIKYSWAQPEMSTGTGFAKTMVSASTLLLVPAMMTEDHTLKATIISGNKVIDTIEYTEKVETALSLYHDPVEDRKNGISRIMDKLFTRIQEDNLIPTVSDIEKSIEEAHPAVLL